MQLALYGGFQKRAAWFNLPGNELADSLGVERPNLWAQGTAALGFDGGMDSWAEDNLGGFYRPKHLSWKDMRDPKVQEHYRKVLSHNQGNQIANFVDNKFSNQKFWDKLKLMFSTVFGRIAETFGWKNNPFSAATRNFKREAARDYMTHQGYDPKAVAELTPEQIDTVIQDPSKFWDTVSSNPALKDHTIRMGGNTAQLYGQAQKAITDAYFGGDQKAFRDTWDSSPEDVDKMVTDLMNNPDWRVTQNTGILEGAAQPVARQNEELGIAGRQVEVPALGTGQFHDWRVHGAVRPEFRHAQNQGVNLWTEEAHPELNKRWNQAQTDALKYHQENNSFDWENPEKNKAQIFNTARERFNPTSPTERGFVNSLSEGSGIPRTAVPLARAPGAREWGKPSPAVTLPVAPTK